MKEAGLLLVLACLALSVRALQKNYQPQTKTSRPAEKRGTYPAPRQERLPELFIAIFPTLLTAFFCCSKQVTLVLVSLYLMAYVAL